MEIISIIGQIAICIFACIGFFVSFCFCVGFSTLKKVKRGIPSEYVEILERPAPMESGEIH